MIKPAELKLEELGDLASIIPGHEPKLEISIDRIPVSETAGKIIPVCEPDLRGRELEYVTDCIQSNWISSAGKYVGEFEERFSEYCGAKYGIACTNGTTALHLAMATLGVGPGDEVIIPTFTMIATANAVTYTGATPVLVDSEPETWNMDISKIKEKITDRTKAIMVMHTYGHPVDMDAVLEIADKHRLYVVEDAAEAHGAEYKGKKIGSLGDVGCFSFYGNKIITTGEGGMLVTNNEEIALISRNLRDHAFSTERHFWHKYLGFNYRMTNLQAAVGLAQVERFDEMVEIRRRNAQYYNQLLENIEGIRTPPEAPWAKNVYWMYSILIEEEFGHTRDEVRRRLAKHGIETRTFFIPIHVQPIYFHKYHERFPVAEELCRRGMYLPSASTLKKREIEYVVDCICVLR
jgi:perosamine synthetase